MDYDYIKNNYRLIPDQKRTQQIEFIEHLKKLETNGNTTNPGKDQSMIVLIMLEKIKGTRLKFSQGSVKVL